MGTVRWKVSHMVEVLYRRLCEGVWQWCQFWSIASQFTPACQNLLHTSLDVPSRAIAAGNDEVEGQAEYTWYPGIQLAMCSSCSLSVICMRMHLKFNNYNVELFTWLYILLSRLVRKIKNMLTLTSAIKAYMKYHRRAHFREYKFTRVKFWMDLIFVRWRDPQK